MQSPFITNNLPDFNKIKINNLVSILTKILNTEERKINKLANSNQYPTWNNFIRPLEIIDEYIHNVVNPINHLVNVNDSEELRKEYQKCLPILIQFSLSINQNIKLYEKFKQIKKDKSFINLSTSQQKIINDTILNFQLNGIHLIGEKQKEFNKISEKLSSLSNEFNKNVLDSTKSWFKHITDKNQLKGIPESILNLLEQNAKEKNLDGYVITLDYPSYSSILKYSENRELRKEIYMASTTIASDQSLGDKKFNNDLIMKKILKLRKKYANLLGYKTYADLSIATKMIKSKEKVFIFLYDIVKKTTPKAIKDNNELTEYVKKYNIKDFEIWDRAFYSEKLLKEKYFVDQNKIKEYFPCNSVILGLFEVVKKLYNIQIQEITGISTWHKDVRFFEIYSNGKKIASFYLDLFTRSSKRSGAWMDSAINKFIKDDGTKQLPVAYIICNFPPPIDNNDSLLTQYDIETLFHEFGHGLHHMLTKIEYFDITGINGVEWDAVELPSQIMEKWCWNYDVLKLRKRYIHQPVKLKNCRGLISVYPYLWLGNRKIPGGW